MTAPSRSQLIHNLSALSKNFDACMDLAAEAIDNGTEHDPIVDPKPPKIHQRPGKRHEPQLTENQQILQRLDKIIQILGRNF